MMALDLSEIADDFIWRDSERLEGQTQEGLLAGAEKLHVEPSPSRSLAPAAGRPKAGYEGERI
jgi:hypothetical protein